MSLRFVLLGHPVAHSLSPVIHRAAYEALALPHRYELLDAPDEAALAAAVAELRHGAIAGANVTIPWKRAALALADRADPSASDVGAANVLLRAASGEVVAHNTDVLALAREIGERAPSVSAGLVLGSGGAALAAVAALRKLGARTVGVSARRFDGSRPAREWPHAGEFERLGAVLVPWASGARARRLRGRRAGDRAGDERRNARRRARLERRGGGALGAARAEDARLRPRL